MKEAEARRTVQSYVSELEGEAIAHQGQRTSDYDEAVCHYRRRARVLRMVLNAVDGVTLAGILTETGSSGRGRLTMEKRGESREMARTDYRDTAQWTSVCEEYAPVSLRVTTVGSWVTFEILEEGRAERKVVLSAGRTRKLLAQIDDVLETLEEK